MPDRFSRQRILRPIGEEGQSRLGRARALLVGCGAIGTHTAEYLVRAGIGGIRLVDRDLVEWSNLQRQIAFTEEDAREGRPKALALAAHLARASSETAIEAHALELAAPNALELAAGADLLLDASDNLPARFLLNDLSYRLAVPWIYAGAVATGGHSAVFSGRGGPCLACYMGTPPPPGTLPTCDTAGILGPAAAAVSSIQAALAVRILTGESLDATAGRLFQIDLWDVRWRESRIAPDPDCPVCAGGRYEYLEGPWASGVTELCGRDAVQVRPLGKVQGRGDLEALARRLTAFGEVEVKSQYVRLRTSGFTMTLFADLRAIFDGLTDPARARSLYARLVGE